MIIIGKTRTLDELKTICPPFCQIPRNRIRIAIFDDKKFDYLDVLQQNDYSVKYFNDITDIAAVAEYDIVLMDIDGVGNYSVPHFKVRLLLAKSEKDTLRNISSCIPRTNSIPLITSTLE